MQKKIKNDYFFVALNISVLNCL